MKDVTKIVIIRELTNIVMIICFTILSIIFNKWWIIFFDILFYRSGNISMEETNKKK